MKKCCYETIKGGGANAKAEQCSTAATHQSDTAAADSDAHCYCAEHVQRINHCAGQCRLAPWRTL